MQWMGTTGSTLSACSVSYPGHSLEGGVLPSAEKQLVYSTAPTDWASNFFDWMFSFLWHINTCDIKYQIVFNIYIYIYVCVCVYMNVYIYIYININAHKTESMCFNQTGDISTLNGSSLKQVDKFTYIKSSVSSTETDINTRQAKVWITNDRLSVIERSDLTD